MSDKKQPGSDGSDDPSNKVTILNPDGSVQQRFATSGNLEPTAPATPETASAKPEKPDAMPSGMAADLILTGSAAGHIPRDNSPALVKRLNDEVAKTAEDQAEDLAEAIYAKFVTLLTDSITEKGGSLTMDDVGEMSEAFKAQLGDIKETFLHAVDTYTMARERNRESTERDNVFHRVMIYPFEQRLVRDAALKDKPNNLPRRMLPGFYNVLSMMFGPPKLARYEENTKRAVDRLLKDTNGQIEWEDVYNSPAVRRIALRSQIDIARHFKNAEKRLDWMVAMVNSILIPLEEGKSSNGWAFTREIAETLLNDLFHDLREVLKSDADRQKLINELGTETVTILDSVTQRFS